MKRRTFLKLSATAASASAAAILLNSKWLFSTKNTVYNNYMTVPQDVKKVFSDCGACSNTFFTLLNREFGFPKEIEEIASDPLAGGLMNTQNQCGMLWGSALAAGAESYRKYENHAVALAKAMNSAQRIVDSYSNRAKSVNCRDVVGDDISKKSDIAEFMLKSLPGGYSNMICMNLAEKWAPEAIRSAKEGLSEMHNVVPQLPKSCASEVARKMGFSEEEMVMVAGFAGGLGLSGNGCGALGAAIWLNTLAWCRKNPGQSGYSNPKAEEILNSFLSATDSEILCSNLAGLRFDSIDDHTQYIDNGGCSKLIDILAQA